MPPSRGSSGPSSPTSTTPDSPVLPSKRGCSLVGALALDAAALVVPGQGFAAATPTATSFGWVLYLAVVPGAVGFLVYFRLLHRLGPIEMGLIEYVIPPFAAVFGWLVLGEGLTPTTGGGFLAILCGFLLVKWPRVVSGIRGYVDGRPLEVRNLRRPTDGARKER